MKPVRVLEPFADPSVLRSQGRETDARRAERFRDECRAQARFLDQALDAAQEDFDRRFRAATLWAESLMTGGLTEHDRSMARLVHIAALVDGRLDFCTEAIAWLREIVLKSRWEQESEWALVLLERLASREAIRRVVTGAAS